MNARQQSILERLGEQEFCGYVELARDLGVSGMTVRRDVDELAGRGVVIKTLRGCRKAADQSPALLYETTLSSRMNQRTREKRLIAEAAAGLIGTRQSIYLDGGTTCLELAKVVASKCRGLTVVTNSALVSLQAGGNGANTVIVIGGQYDPASASFVGPVAEETAQKYCVDVAFFSTKGILVRDGTFESSMPTFRIKQIIARQTTEVVLLADHTKFGQRALSKVLDIGQIHAVVTDPGAPKGDLAALRRRGIKVSIASAGRG